MSKIAFHNTLYELASSPNITPFHFQASIYKGDNTYDFIIDQDTLNVSEIKIYNDDNEIIGIYTGYSHRVAITIMEGSDSVSVELENTDVMSQINALTNNVAALQAMQNSQQTSIENLNDTKLNSSIIGTSETIGEPSINSYEIGDTFAANGNYYKAVATIIKGNILVENGNCELTTIEEELATNTEEEN